MNNKSMDPDPLEYSEFLDMMPAYRTGRLSPVDAHRIKTLIAQDPIFRKEAKRDEVIAEAIAATSEDPLPRGLVHRSVAVATGGEQAAKWFSLDTILIALGVGVAGAGLTEFVSDRVDIVGFIGEWIGSMTGIAVQGGLQDLLGAIMLGTLGVLSLVAVWAIRLLRSEQ